MDNASDYKDRLLRELKETEALLAANAAASAPVPLDQQSVGRLARMDAMQVQAMARDAEARRRLRRTRIFQALRRIERDTHGFCVDCDEPIGDGRLDVDPTFERCIRCAGR